MPPVHLCRFRLRVYRALCDDTPPLRLSGGVQGHSPRRFLDCGMCSASLRCCTFGAGSFSLLFSLPLSLFLPLSPPFLPLSPSLLSPLSLSLPLSPLFSSLLPPFLFRAPATHRGYTSRKGMSPVVVRPRGIFKMRFPPSPPPWLQLTSGLTRTVRVSHAQREPEGTPRVLRVVGKLSLSGSRNRDVTPCYVGLQAGASRCTPRGPGAGACAVPRPPPPPILWRHVTSPWAVHFPRQ